MKKAPELTTKQLICGAIIVLLAISVFGFTGSLEWGKITAAEYLLIMAAHFVVMLITACIGGEVIIDADEKELHRYHERLNEAFHGNTEKKNRR